MDHAGWRLTPYPAYKSGTGAGWRLTPYPAYKSGTGLL
ncbi:Hypothetical protein ABZS17D1_02406 [Kosakonia cowanii]